MSLRSLKGLVLGVVLVGIAGPAWSTQFEDPQAIRAAVQAVAANQATTAGNARVEVDVGSIDPRIHLAECAQLHVTLPQTLAPMLTARVRCETPFWTLYVPLRMHAWSRAVVAATNLMPNTTLDASDLAMARVDVLATNGGYLTDPAQAEGKILRTNVRAGAPILSALLERPWIVHRGETVLLTLRDNAITIRTNVVAMQDGRSGDMIMVQNPDSKKTVQATVTSRGGVEIRFDEAQAGE